MDNKEYRLATLAVRGGFSGDTTGSVNLPIHPTTAYNFQDAEHAADLFDLKVGGNIYSRINNPTMDAFSERLNLLDGGSGALALSSGQSATLIAITNLCEEGDHFITASSLYGGTYSLFTNTFRKYGIQVSFVDPAADEDTLFAAIRPNTKLIFAETIGNPRMNVLDLNKFSSLARRSGLPLVLDNTFATPALLRCKDYGANILVYSATKYLGGHGNSLGGVIVDLGNFDWGNGKFPNLTDPDPSYHGISYWETFGNAAFIVKARVQLLRDLGCAMSPFNAWILSMGMETLPLRMQKHSENALALARHLENHPKVTWVSYPGLESSPDYRLTRQYLPQGASGMLAFGVLGGRSAGETFINSVEMSNLVTNLGDTRTLVVHPASTTHRQLSEEQQVMAGVLPDMIRVSVGIEDIADIIDDFEQALARIR